MAQLEDNLKLGLQAVKYAKSQVKRSANQTYFKPGASSTDKKRNEFILGATRGGNYIKQANGDWTRDDTMAKRRKELLQIIQSTDSLKQKEAKIDAKRILWGEDYFWDGTAKWKFTDLRTYESVAKTLGMTEKQVRDGVKDGRLDDLIDLFCTFSSANKAIKYGVGNCQEKGEIACTYIMNHAPGNTRLALYQLEPGHKGFTGKFTGEGGDHVFGIYGFDTVTDNISTLGPNAIVLDGWMNDAYPAQKHLDWKHGYNYNNERINLKQLTVRNMVCVSYKAHVICMRNFGMLPAGPGTIPAPTLVRTKF